eukprot:2814054-Pyramimonas_sp.AAC.1
MLIRRRLPSMPPPAACLLPVTAALALALTSSLEPRACGRLDLSSPILLYPPSDLILLAMFSRPPLSRRP